MQYLTLQGSYIGGGKTQVIKLSYWQLNKVFYKQIYEGDNCIVGK